MKNNVFWAIVLVVIFFYMSENNPAVVIEQDATSGLEALVDGQVSFNGRNMFKTGTSITSEDVRVLTEGNDLGNFTLDSGRLDVTPNENYKFYFFMNATGPSTTYYVSSQDYTAPVQDATDNVVGDGCEIDTTPSIVIKNSNGQSNMPGTQQAVGTTETVSMEISVKPNLDTCYGTPGAPKKNALCLNYNSTAFTTVESNTNWISTPQSFVGADLTNRNVLKCFEFDVLEDGARDTMTVSLTSGATDPTATSHNISVFVDDIAFDLNADNLEEIWDYVDEDNNQLGDRVNVSLPDDYIFIS